MRGTHRAIVLKVRDYGEGHRLVDLFTEESGLERAFAPSGRRSQRRFAGAFDPMTLLSATVERPPGRGLVRLKEARVLNGWPGIRSSLEGIARGAYLVDLARALLREAKPEPEIFALLVAGLQRLESGCFRAWHRLAYELGLLAAFGALPVFDACVRCQRRSTGEQARFSPALGGLLCPRCGPRWGRHDTVLPRRGLLAAAALAEAGSAVEVFERADHLPDDSAAAKALTAALTRFVEAQVGRRLPSLDFLTELEEPL